MQIVIKIGGSVLEHLHSAFFQECLQLKEKGLTPVIVHGGGPVISQWMDQLGFQPQFVDGLRVTDEQTLTIVEMVLAGSVNKHLVTKFRQAGAKAIGMTGIDLGLIQVEPLNHSLGFVGRVTHVNKEVIQLILDQGWIPVIASLGVDHEGQHYNVNADDVASAIADALKAKKLISVSNVDGIQINDQPLKQATADEIEAYIRTGEITGGMIPKVRSGLRSLTGSVQEVVIVNGQQPGCLTDDSHGTRLIKGEVKSHVFISHL
ncbi:acetylglutamate kinase [Thermoflavimicrobium dichotomicum]|uniref:Acetylglutamate kinase n=1 Tax=Thermoflavimicrobium dichotomicum TaxID=46223 RepID=A0A1I3NXS0_9BACL|nr:acetylglutamate kinase [Thermoflavimicrobium dichotomicum]SFJ14075.1 acetylglutamate kinase [Thermoflavimicrobium dichotomicum]